MNSPSPPNHRRFALGVDGGGTKTMAWIGTIDDAATLETVGKGNAGSSNLVAVGAEQALQNLAKAVEKACNDARIDRCEITAAVLAMAGSGHKDGRERILNYVQDHLQIGNAEIAHDGLAALEAGTHDGWGAALIAGTGAVAFGKNRQGDEAVVGGWGYWFGDEGSAYWIGQQALRAISHAADSRGPLTALTDKLLHRLEAADPREILSGLSNTGDVRSAIADLAQLVCETAELGDASAASILDEAAAHWTDHIAAIKDRLSINEPLPLALAGGVLCGSELARSRLYEHLKKQQIATTPPQLVPDPVAGCVKLACRKIQLAN